MNQPKSPEEVVRQFGDFLSTAINSGDKENAEKFAANLALSGAKVTITVDTSSLKKDLKDAEFSIKVYVEDREASGGCINLKVKATDTVLDLKNKMFLKHSFPVEVQKWIIGKRMPPDTENLQKAKVTPGQSVFLYLVSARSLGLNKEEVMARKEQMLYAQGQPGGFVTGQPGGFVMQNFNESGDYMRMAPKTPVTPQSANLKSSPSPGLRPTQQHPQAPPAAQGNQLTREKRASQGRAPQQGENKPPQGVRRSSGSQQSFEFLDLPPEFRQDPLSNQMTASSGARQEPEQIGWQCPDCTYINKPTWPGCEICSKDRPATYKVPDNYEMTKEEEERLKREQESEQRAQKAATDRRPREMTNEEVITQLGERELDQLLKFNDALQETFINKQGKNDTPEKNPPEKNLPFGPQPTLPGENQQLPAPVYGYNIPPDGAAGGNPELDRLQFHMEPKDIKFDDSDH